MDRDELPPVGRVAQINLSTGQARFAIVLRLASDSDDHRRCSTCNRPFRYGPIGKHCITGNLVCLRDCTKD